MLQSAVNSMFAELFNFADYVKLLKTKLWLGLSVSEQVVPVVKYTNPCVSFVQ